MQDGKWGYIDRSGKLVIKPHYDRAMPFSEGLAQVRLGGIWKYIDSTGQVILHRSGGPFRYGLAATRDSNLRWGFMDKSGALRISPEYKLVNDFREGVAAVIGSNGLWGFIDTKGNIVVDTKHVVTCDFHEGLASCGIASNITYINRNGEVEIALSKEFTRGHPFQEGLALVAIGYKNGYINRSGEVVIEPDEKYSYWHWSRRALLASMSQISGDSAIFLERL